MTFEEKIERLAGEAEEEFFLDLANSGFAFDRLIDGETIAFRRSKDTAVGERVETEFFCFPQNGRKDKMKMGMLLRFTVRPENAEDMEVHFTEAESGKAEKAGRSETYYSQVASRAGRELAKEGVNTFLHHEVVIRTPEKEEVLLNAFDFEANKLFMLGLYGGEYKCFAVKKEV
ncbi:MAG: hypothetical protein K6E30_10045 [Lachnospiraceae bacterium]|nr:hypothetical protein [Lachnospiraceae bacterium]